ncbi:MAG TPA: GNAT family protein [Ktedonobacterales bacterium]|nr:GNAT family protein [Ktedonobacterales bacterium]
MESSWVTIREVTRENWRAALALGVAPEQQRFIADYAPIAAIGLAKAYIRPGGLIWQPYAFFTSASPVASATPDVAGAMVGFTMVAYASERAGDAWIFHFFIDQRFQGQGYGTLALHALITHIRERLPQCRAIHLTVHPENARAQRLYLRAGFRPTGELIDGEPRYTHNL